MTAQRRPSRPPVVELRCWCCGGPIRPDGAVGTTFVHVADGAHWADTPRGHGAAAVPPGAEERARGDR